MKGCEGLGKGTCGKGFSVGLLYTSWKMSSALRPRGGVFEMRATNRTLTLLAPSKPHLRNAVCAALLRTLHTVFPRPSSLPGIQQMPTSYNQFTESTGLNGAKCKQNCFLQILFDIPLFPPFFFVLDEILLDPVTFIVTLRT